MQKGPGGRQKEKEKEERQRKREKELRRKEAEFWTSCTGAQTAFFHLLYGEARPRYGLHVRPANKLPIDSP